MDRTTVAQARLEESIGKQVQLQGWVRTRRDSKGGFSFIELNDGSCFGNVQIVADGNLANYESEIKKLNVGCSVTIEGEIRKSPKLDPAAGGLLHPDRLGRVDAVGALSR